MVEEMAWSELLGLVTVLLWCFLMVLNHVFPSQYGRVVIRDQVFDAVVFCFSLATLFGALITSIIGI